METYANGIADDEMISSLSFKIDPTANMSLIGNPLLISHRGVRIIPQQAEQ